MLALLLSFSTWAKAPPVFVGDDAALFSLPLVNEGFEGSLGRNQVALSDYVGVAPALPKEAAVIYFFDRRGGGASLEGFERLHKKYSGKGVQFIAISVDRESTIGDWINPMKLSFPVLTDQYQIVRSRYGVDSPPLAVVVDAEGNVHSMGNPENDVETQIDAQLMGLIEE